MASAGRVNQSDRAEHRQLIAVLTAVRPYLDRIVVIGGWVPALYRDYGGLGWAGRLSRTTEVDVLVSPPVPVREWRLEDLLRATGFEPQGSGGPAAVWAQSVAEGAMVEFLSPLEGPQGLQGSTQPLAGHGQVGSIRLANLGFLGDHTTTLEIPLRSAKGPEVLQVRIPTLGAYVVNKALTFPGRPHQAGGDRKRAKDILYLRDVAAAGPAVTDSVRDDVVAILNEGRSMRMTVDRARSNLRMATRGSLRPLAFREAALMLAEREALDPVAAAADLNGYLADLVDLLDEAERGGGGT